LPLVEDIDSRALQKHIQRLHPIIKDALTESDRKTLQMLSASKEDIGEDVQKLLDPYCLVGVNINPESRVKAARGPRAADLALGRETLILIKIQNDAGVTEGLKVSGDQLRPGANGDKDRWLEIVADTAKQPRPKLSGQKLEYVVLRFKPHESGKREATLKFDVGQGTQDLGFRAEVPILFTIKSE
jgi:hypothetical protein